MPRNAQLRRELEAAMAIFEPAAYVKRLDQLREKFNHSVFILPDGSDRLRRFNCYAYAFGIWDHPDFVALVENTGKSAIMNSTFIEAELARGRLQEADQNMLNAGDIIIYFRDGKPAHAGKIAAFGTSLTVHSKWGPSETHAHDVWHVPESYGDELGCFKPIDPESILDRLYDNQNQR
jgi:hypothetical protein